jgi:hypothetical protein
MNRVALDFRQVDNGRLAGPWADRRLAPGTLNDQLQALR